MPTQPDPEHDFLEPVGYQDAQIALAFHVGDHAPTSPPSLATIRPDADLWHELPKQYRDGFCEGYFDATTTTAWPAFRKEHL